MGNTYQETFCRNIGILSPADQDRLRGASVAVAGMGGVGGLLAERLIRSGIENLKITDPGRFEQSNLNRQFGSSVSNLNQNKAEVLYSHLKEINPEARISWSGTGVKTEEDAAALAADCQVVADEMDMGMFKESIALQRAARRRGAYYLFTCAYGFGALIAVFDPQGMTLEEYNGLPAGVDIANPENLKVPFTKIMPVMPSYANAVDQETIKKMHTGELPGSAISIGAGLAAVLAANEITNLILNKRPAVFAPQYIYVDLMDQCYTIRSVRESN